MGDGFDQHDAVILNLKALVLIELHLPCILNLVLNELNEVSGTDMFGQRILS